MKVLIPWTMKEIQDLKDRRRRGEPVKAIAARFGRTAASVRQKLNTLRIVVCPKPPPTDTVRDTICALARRGHCDTVIALKVGRCKRTVREHRKAAGLPANPHQSWSQTAYHKRHRCMNCDRLCPVAATTGWKKLTGWTSRPVYLTGAKTYLILCNGCSHDGN